MTSDPASPHPPGERAPLTDDELSALRNVYDPSAPRTGPSRSASPADILRLLNALDQARAELADRTGERDAYMKSLDITAAECDQATRRAESLEGALREVSHIRYGEPCWCGMRSPLSSVMADHSQGCLAARAALLGEAREGEG